MSATKCCPTCNSTSLRYFSRAEKWQCRYCEARFDVPVNPRRPKSHPGSGQIAGRTYLQQVLRERLASHTHP